MKKYFLTVIVVVVLTANYTQAQITFGVHTGLNLSTMSSKLEGKKSEVSDHIKYKSSFQIGVIGEKTINEKFAGQLCVLFNTQGWEFNIKEQDHKSATNLNYIQIRVNPMYKFDIDKLVLFFQVAPYIGYALSGKSKIETIIDGITDKYDRKIEFGNEFGKMKIWDFGIGLGTGVQFDNIQIGLCYNRGFANLSNTEKVSEKINGFALTISYMLNK